MGQPISSNQSKKPGRPSTGAPKRPASPGATL